MGNHITLWTDIWLVVKVPVLSEQITDVQPSVSTEGRLRTIAFFLAILRVPTECWNILGRVVTIQFNVL